LYLFTKIHGKHPSVISLATAVVGQCAALWSSSAE